MQKLRLFLKSFSNAICGLIICAKNERNFRIHIVACAYVSALAALYGLSKTECAVLVFVMSMVFISEMLNTAVETIVDIKAESYNALAKMAKDIAAGAVLVSAFASVITAALLFGDIKKLGDTVSLFANPLYLIPFVISIVISVLFINMNAKGRKN